MARMSTSADVSGSPRPVMTMSNGRRRASMKGSLPGARGEADAWLAAIVESSNDAIVSKTIQGVIRSWNPGAERLFGYRADEATGQPITMLFPADRLHEEAEFMRRIQRGERIDRYETIRIRKDGTPVPVSVTRAPT